MGVATMALTVLIGSRAAFAIGRLKPRRLWLLSNAALLTYLIPASFLAIAFHRTMQLYGLADNLWAVIAAQVTFTTPYAILVLQQERETSARSNSTRRHASMVRPLYRSIGAFTFRCWRRRWRQSGHSHC